MTWSRTWIDDERPPGCHRESVVLLSERTLTLPAASAAPTASQASAHLLLDQTWRERVPLPRPLTSWMMVAMMTMMMMMMAARERHVVSQTFTCLDDVSADAAPAPVARRR